MNKLKNIKKEEIIGIFKFFIVLIPAFIKKIYLKLKKEEVWVICELENMARDNGYYFFKYMKENHKKVKCLYAINQKSNDYNKIKQYKKDIVEWGSIKHYFYFMSATKNISSEKNGNPNHILFSILLLYLKLYNNRYFLQHGVLYQNLNMFHKRKTRFKFFCCGAKPEYDFVKKKFGYDSEVKYTGLARFDNLHNTISDKNCIIYMPTWRRWLTQKEKLLESIYFQKIIEILNDKRLNEILEKYDKYLYFCPHKGLYDNKEVFESNNSRIKIVDLSCADIQNILIKGSLLITDYSSVHTDFAYMKKPIIYYQYDIEEFKEKHIGKCNNDNYYDYKENGFGKVTNNKVDLINEIEKVILNDFKEEKIYLNRIENFFVLRDNKNCERIYEEILRI